MGQNSGSVDENKFQFRTESEHVNGYSYGYSSIEGSAIDFHRFEKEKFRLSERLKSTYITEGGNISVFAIFDGHESGKSAQFCSKKLPEMIFKYETKKLSSMPDLPLRLFTNDETIENAHVEVDNLLKREFALGKGSSLRIGKKYDHSGCASNCIFLVPCKRLGVHELIVSNVGASKTVLFDRSRLVELSVPHLPSNQREIERVELAGSTVSRGLVHGYLPYTRAFGHYEFKSSKKDKDDIISCVPSVVRYDLNLGDIGGRSQYRFFVQGNANLWKLRKSSQVCEFVRKRLKEQEYGVYYKNRLIRLKKLYKKFEKYGIGKTPEHCPENAKDGEYDLGSIAEEMIETYGIPHFKKVDKSLSVVIVVLKGEWDLYGI